MYLPFIMWISIHLPFSEKLKGMEEEVFETSTQNVLILGDSHMVGDFGEYLHREIHELGKYNVVSIGIGGAGSYHFTVKMRGFCCGYKIRETCWYDSIPEKSKMPVVEEGYGSSNAIVGKFFKGNLSNYISHYDPEIVIIALGSNYTNAHEDLLKIIRKDKIDREVIWVGPMLRSNIQMRITAINQVIKKYPDIHFVRSDDIIGHDTITTVHYSGKSAQRWAEKVVLKMDKHLD
jgi:hypothetical protein